MEPLIPKAQTAAAERWDCGVEDRAMFTTIVSVLSSGCPWRHL
ncbi:hypothetical protein OHR68_13855 [Spirillospora sp. NBC_00431]